ncbi:MAG TPA: flagellar protein FlaG [Nitrospirales bacterium]|nr:flagellar protein FlaG [Nitrospirales bacterium]
MIDNIDAVAGLPPAPAGTPARQEAPSKPAKTTESSHEPVVSAAPPSYGFALRVDPKTHEVIAVITDPVTHAAIREIPPEEMQTASNVIRNLIGPLIDKIA